MTCKVMQLQKITIVFIRQLLMTDSWFLMSEKTKISPELSDGAMNWLLDRRVQPWPGLVAETSGARPPQGLVIPASGIHIDRFPVILIRMPWPPPPPPILEPYAFALFFAALASLFFGILAWKGTRKAIFRNFAFFQFTIFIWCMFRFAQWSIPSPGDQMFALELQFGGIAFLPTTIFMFARALAGKPVRSFRHLLLLFLPSSLALVLVLSNSLHRLFWSDGGYDFKPIIKPTPGPAFWVFVAYAYCLMIASIFELLKVTRRIRGVLGRILLRVVIVFALPLTVNIVYVFFFQSRTSFDPTPLVYTAFGLFVWIALHRYNIFNVIPFTANIFTESIDSPILVADEDGYAMGANDRAKNLLCPETAIEGKIARQLCPAIEGLLPGSPGRPWSSGGKDYLVSSNEVIEGRKRLPGAIFVFRDVTALVGVTRELGKAKARAEEANAAKSAFVATVSHELRNPLNAIIGLADLDLRAGPPPEMREDLETILASGNLLLGLVNDLLDLSKIEAGRMELERTDFNLHEKAVSVLKAFRPAAEKKGLFLDITIAADTPRFVNGDSLRYGQVLMNLVSNAIKFTDYGSVAVEIAPLPAPEGENDSHSLVALTSVRDTGIGIAPEKMPIIFQEFSQADPTVSRRFGGTGLGLSICKKLVGLFGGEIEARSSEGKGSVFSFTARFGLGEAERARPAPKPEITGTGGRTLRVLIVDDDPINIAVARRYIERRGHAVVSAGTGSAALGLVDGVDLILLDLGLPDMDGFEASRRIHAETAPSSSGDVPIAAMTARAESGVRAACATAGMIDCIAKPLDPIALDRLLDRVAAKVRDLGPRAAASLPLPRLPVAEAPGEPPPALPETPLVDVPALLSRLDGDGAFMRKLLGIFIEEAPGRRKAFDTAAAARDIDALQRQSHAIKGSSLSLCARPLGASAGALEAACIAAKRSGFAAEDLFISLSPIFDELYGLLESTAKAASSILGPDA